jgi:hypothetical protein
MQKNWGDNSSYCPKYWAILMLFLLLDSACIRMHIYIVVPQNFFYWLIQFFFHICSITYSYKSAATTM